MSKASKYCCFIATGLLSFSASCTKQEDTSMIPITLYENVCGTKTILSDTVLPDSYTIYASAYYTNLAEDGLNGDYFVATPFRKNDGIWSAIPTAYWPLGGKLDFLFIAFEDTAIDIGERVVWSEGNSTKGVEVDVSDGDCPDSEILFATTLNRKSMEGGVPVHFNHTQSWIQFVVSSDKTDLLRIDRIVIDNVYAGGTLRITNDIYLDAVWSFRGHHRSNLTVPESENIVVNADSPSACGILIPEQETCNISLYYSARSSTEEDWDSARSSVFHYKPVTGIWHSGEKTVYTIRFSFQEISFTPSVEKWGYDEKEINVPYSEK